MHLITVTTAQEGSAKAYVMANSLVELISAAQTELHLDVSQTYTVFQEPSGIKIGSDGVLHLLICNCEKAQQTLEVSLSTSTSRYTPKITNCQSTSILTETNTSPMLPMRPIVEVLAPVLDLLENPRSISPKTFLKMKKSAIKEVYTIISKFMLQSVKEASLPFARHCAKAVIHYKEKKYAKIFQIKVGSSIVNDGVGTLALQVYNHLNYSKGDDNKKKRGKRKVRSEETENEEEVDGDLEIQMDKTSLDYGCVNYAPLLAEDETEATQETMRQKLLLLDSHDPEATILLEKTFSSQRADLNRAVPLPSKLLPVLERWPLLTCRDHLFSHSARLLGKQVLDIWLTNMGGRSQRFCDFMLVYWLNEHDKKSGPLTRSMMDILDQRSVAFEAIGQMANSICFFPLLIGYLKENQNQLFILIPKNSTDDEMLNAAKQISACPLLVVRGTSIFEEEADFDIILLGKKNIKSINFIEGILTVFVSYFIFGFQYPSKISRSLEFIQRFLLDINPEKGSRREKPSRLTDGLDSKVRELSERLAYHGSEWEL